ncbi:MAG: hypothetical protein ACXU8U_10915 [Asticcacaulis sp.]
MAVHKANPHEASEVHFWACLIVALALLAQVFFPPQVMAATTDHGTTMVLCTGGMDAAPIVDPALAKVIKAVHKSGLQGLKCANCVLASITAIVTPDQSFIPAVYGVTHIVRRPAERLTPVHARAPPRPFSCGPPLSFQA